LEISGELPTILGNGCGETKSHEVPISEEKREPVSDVDTAAADSLKMLDPKRPIREADLWDLTETALMRMVRGS